MIELKFQDKSALISRQGGELIALYQGDHNIIWCRDGAVWGNSAPLLLNDRKIVDCMRKRTEAERTIVRMKVSVSEELLKKARKLAIELFSTMDIKNDEENLCGQIAALLSDWKKKKSI